MFMAGASYASPAGAVARALALRWRVDKLRRLWQPRHPMFWMMLGFNVLSSVCSWAMRALPLSSAGLLLIGTVALINVALGLLAAWRLMRGD
jgi:hypothetical protein